jgi:hypothetical protein
VSTKSPQPEVFRGVKRMDVLDGASVSSGSLFSQRPGTGRHMDGDRSDAVRRWMVPVQDGNDELRFVVRVAVSMRRAFGGCLGTRRR